ncbi:MAG: hypothetical protein FWE37_02080 [Spirochaetaceae bacterium]|nr:hypothetical protein [Spirochaetaceae bacterium]
MKKILILFLLLIAINAQGQGLPVAANATLASLFPDASLRERVARILGEDANLTGQALSDRLAKVRELYAHWGPFAGWKKINNTNGIEYLIGLSRLNLSSNDLMDINLTNLIYLTELYLNGNQLTQIDLTSLKSLRIVELVGNRLIQLDLSNQLLVYYLDVSGNPLTDLDLTMLVSLSSLNVGYTLLTSLDISNNPILHLWVWDSPLERYVDFSEGRSEFHSHTIKLREGLKHTIIGLRDDIRLNKP